MVLISNQIFLLRQLKRKGVEDRFRHRCTTVLSSVKYPVSRSLSYNPLLENNRWKMLEDNRKDCIKHGKKQEFVNRQRERERKKRKWTTGYFSGETGKRKVKFKNIIISTTFESRNALKNRSKKLTGNKSQFASSPAPSAPSLYLCYFSINFYTF